MQKTWKVIEDAKLIEKSQGQSKNLTVKIKSLKALSKTFVKD